MAKRLRDDPRMLNLRKPRTEQPGRDGIGAQQDAGPPQAPSAARLLKPQSPRADVAFRLLVTAFGLAVLALAVIIIAELYLNARPLIQRDGLSFIWRNAWDVNRDVYGAGPLLFGTLVSSALAVLFAVPVAIGVALFVTEMAPPWLRRPVSSLIELLAAIPSVAYGFWGLLVLVPILQRDVDPFLIRVLGWSGLFARPDFGVSLFTAGIVLAIMILPIIAAISREVFTVVPAAQREAALALGATKWESIRMAVLPFSRSGVIGGVVLGLGRAMGETMAVVFVIGNNPVLSKNLLSAGSSVTSQIANTFAEVSTTGHQLSALLYLALVLFVITLIVNVGARVLVWRANAISGGVR